jgi:hypothetical protein
VRVDGDTTRMTDVRFDPKQLCPGAAGTVQAPYRVSVAGDDAGRITFESRALDQGGRPLATASIDSRVVKAQAQDNDKQQQTKAPDPADSKAPIATPSPIAPAGAGADDTAAPPAAAPGGDIAADKTSSDSGIPSLLGPGLIVGAVLVLAGLALLLVIRRRNRRGERAMARQQMYQQAVYEQQRYNQQAYAEQGGYEQPGYEQPYDRQPRVTYSGQ